MLGELIDALKAVVDQNPDAVVPDGFCNPHSYRGYYEQLAFEPAQNVRVRDMLLDAEHALGSTFQGWKGGDYTMDEHTDCWLAHRGDSDGEMLGPLLLRLMLERAR